MRHKVYVQLSIENGSSESVHIHLEAEVVAADHYLESVVRDLTSRAVAKALEASK